MRIKRRGPRLAVDSGERILAWAATLDGRQVAGTRDALYVESPQPVERARPEEPTDEASRRVETTRLPWEEVQAADWDPDTSTLRVSEVGAWGQQRPEHVCVLEDPRRLLQLIRERVSASVVLQRRVPVRGRLGLLVIARRAPRGDRPMAWHYEYDDGLDPADPEVARVARAALATAREEIGD